MDPPHARTGIPLLTKERSPRGASFLRATRARLVQLTRPESALLLVTGSLLGVGAMAILAGWRGAARTVLLAEQIPYLISGGILGLALVFVGSLAYFGHVQSGSIRDARAREQDEIRRHDEVMATLGRVARSDQSSQS